MSTTTTQATAPQTLTYGQKAVGLTFNPSGNPLVNRIKERAAALADELYEQMLVAKSESNGEKIANYMIGIRDCQSSSSAGVRAATWQY